MKQTIKDQLKQIAGSYDRSIDLGRRGIDSYTNFPASITEHPNYPLFQQMKADEALSDSGRKEIAAYLAPKAGTKFVDLGCCLNLWFRGYKDWPSDYYGIDISTKTIELLREFTKKNHLTVGELYCGSMHETPYAPCFFDIGACIGSLEYFERDFVLQAITEFHRILKPDGKFVLDIPNVGTPEFEITRLIEEYLGRPDRFDLSAEEFESMLDPYFITIKKEAVGPMIQYFLICKK